MSVTTTLLVVVGLISGAGLGYAIQASRSFDRRFGRVEPSKEPGHASRVS